LINIIETYKNQLFKAGIENASNEINWFLEKKFKFKKENILLQEIILNNHQLKIIKNFINRRIHKEPFQYIVNTAPFYDVDLYIDQNVLIPRPETETIINILIEQKHTFNSALDLCTGSGNLALILSLKTIAKKITAIDCSQKALSVAKKNFTNYKAKNIHCIKLNFLNKKINNKYDLIVCNPPYISNDEYETLEPEVKNFEPKKALTDSKDGLTFYKKINEELNNIINPGGMLLLEIGLEKHKPIVEEIFINENCKWHKDQNSNYRIIQIFK